MGIELFSVSCSVPSSLLASVKVLLQYFLFNTCVLRSLGHMETTTPTLPSKVANHIQAATTHIPLNRVVAAQVPTHPKNQVNSCTTTGDVYFQDGDAVVQRVSPANT